MIYHNKIGDIGIKYLGFSLSKLMKLNKLILVICIYIIIKNKIRDIGAEKIVKNL